MTFTLERHDYLYAVKEGVGSYGAGAAPVIGDNNRCQGFTLVNLPTTEEVNDKTPRRQGLPLQIVGETNDWTGRAWFRDYTVPSSDDATRPTIDFWLEVCGFIQSYDDNGGPGPYTRTYELQDYNDLMNSGRANLYKVHSDGAGATVHDLSGMRGTGTITFTPGRPIEFSCEGKGISYVGPVTDTPVDAPVYPNVAAVRFAESGNITLTQTGGSGAATYTGPINSMEIRCNMDVGETPGGDQTGVDEVTLIPKDAYEWDIQIDRQPVAQFNGLDLWRNSAILTMTMVHPLPTAGNFLDITLVGQIMSLEEGVVSNGRETYTLKCKGVYQTGPGTTPTPAFSIVFRTP